MRQKPECQVYKAKRSHLLAAEGLDVLQALVCLPVLLKVPYPLVRFFAVPVLDVDLEVVHQLGAAAAERKGHLMVRVGGGKGDVYNAAIKEAA